MLGQQKNLNPPQCLNGKNYSNQSTTIKQSNNSTIIFIFTKTYSLTTERYFLKKTDKLKSRKAIDILFAKGKSFTVFPFRICYLITDFEPGIIAGFSATTKTFKKATDRNKIKRLTREAYRLQKNELAAHQKLTSKGLYIFFIYTGKEVPTYDFIFEKTGVVLKKLIKQLDENN